MRLRHLPFCLVAMVTLTGALPAQAAEQNAPAGTYTIDPRHSQVIFAIRHMGLSTFYARLGEVTGNLTFDPQSPTQSKLDAKIETGGLSTHVPKLDTELTAAPVFDSAKFPNATFRSTKITQTGPNTGTVTGNLTIKDVTRPVTLNVTFGGGLTPPVPTAKYRIGFDATAHIRRSDFGLDKMFWSKVVGDDVNLQIEAELEHEN